MFFKRGLGLLFLLCSFSLAFSNEPESLETIENDEVIEADLAVEFEEYSPTFKDYLLSCLSTQLDNLLLSFYNIAIVPKAYSIINLDVMWHNISNPWVWDNDEFYINQICHPYQGSMYFEGARSNGLNFYESLAVTAFGSLTWELLMENETPSYNDLLITTIQGSLFGEVLHRLYLDSTGKIPILPVIIAPQSAFNSFVRGRPSPNYTQNHVQELSLGLGGGIYSTVKSIPKSTPFYERTFVPQLNFSAFIRYGDVYKDTTFSPLESFTVDAIGGLIYNNSFSMFLSASGPMFSIVPDYSIPSAWSLDLVYQYYFEFIDTDFSNNALGATFQQKIDINENTSFEWKEQLQFAFLAGYDCHYLLIETKRSDPFGLEQRLYDFGIGIGNDVNLIFKNPTIGNLKLDLYAGIFKTLPGTIQTEGSDGFSAVEYISLDYEHKIYKNLYLAANSLFYFRQAFYDNLEDYTQFMNNTTAFVRYKFL